VVDVDVDVAASVLGGVVPGIELVGLNSEIL
jgi:hypothetical protein